MSLVTAETHKTRNLSTVTQIYNFMFRIRDIYQPYSVLFLYNFQLMRLLSPSEEIQTIQEV